MKAKNTTSVKADAKPFIYRLSLSLRAKLLITSSSITCLVCAFSAFFAVKGYYSEKQAHLFEVHALGAAII